MTEMKYSIDAFRDQLHELSGQPLIRYFIFGIGNFFNRMCKMIVLIGHLHYEIFNGNVPRTHHIQFFDKGNIFRFSFFCFVKYKTI